jgi:hypothetical protein
MKARAGDRRTDDEIGRELLKLEDLMRSDPRVGGHYLIALGMEWALKWASHRGNSPTHTLNGLTADDSARELARAHDEILRAIDAFMKDKGEQLFGGAR